jgi:hypothetical protein
LAVGRVVLDEGLALAGAAVRVDQDGVLLDLAGETRVDEFEEQGIRCRGSHAED